MEIPGVQGNIEGMDQAEFSKLSFCGLGCALKFTDKAEIDACNFERINVDGCAVGVWFAPEASYYTHFRKFVFADNPFYGFYADGTKANLHNLELLDNIFVRSGGGFTGETMKDPGLAAAVYFNNINSSLIRGNLIDDPGTFWFFEKDACKNEMRQPAHRETEALVVRGNNNCILNNIVKNSTAMAIHIIGDGNVLINNIVDNDVIIEGKNNQVSGMIFTNPESKLIMNGKNIRGEN